MRKIVLIAGSCLLFVLSCQKEKQEVWKPLDLLQYGIPITILAPDSSQVKSDDLGGLMKDVTIKAGDDYSVQIYATDALTTDLAKIKAGQLAEVKGNRYFSKIVEEEETGFIYEMMLDTSNINYGFRHVRVQGDKEFVFQPGLVGTFTLEEAKRMYEAVKPQPKK